MSHLSYDCSDPHRPCARTAFGTYRIGYDRWYIFTDIADWVPEGHDPAKGVTVVWALLGDMRLYAGFDIEEAFAACEEDFEMRIAGSLGAYRQPKAA